ncbi:MAG: ABC transporter ATP-binding protein [Lachnospiraceae bacterium]|nr:ABC transporter ATP-binding protein [Lachnospiraceae bacterium]
MIQLNNVSYSYKKKGFGIHNINLKLEEGYFTTLLGKNGAGKTTLLKNIYMLYKAKEGDVIWGGNKVDLNNLHLFRKDVAIIDDGFKFSTSLTLEENVDFFGMLYESFDRSLFDSYIKQFDLDVDLKNNYFDKLSKGEKVKFQLAFVLARNPKYLIMDEPFANLDPVVKTDLIDIIHRKVMEDGMGVLMSTHLVEDVTDITDFIVVMDNGSIKLSGDRESVLASEKIEGLRELVLS